MNQKNLLTTLLALFTLTINLNCASKFESPVSSDIATAETPIVQDAYYPLAWEAKQADSKNWSEFVFNLIRQETPELIQGAEDIALFCPNYYKLDTNERINFWGLLVSGIVKYESNFDPTSRMRETTMGTDPITGEQVFSEGLMQLSYQDSRNHQFCDEFDWESDKHLDPDDPNKSILDPYKNLNCGVKILAKQIRNRNRITLSSGIYWAVIRADGKRNKIPEISALTKKMPGCM